MQFILFNRTEQQLNKTIMKLIEPLSSRFSPMKFIEGKKISKEERNLIFEAARWAPSSYNEQPWRYVYADNTDKEGFNRILSALNEYNQKWAREASMLVVAIASENLAATGKHNNYAWYDTGQSVSQMIVQAASMGVQAHQMGGFDSKRAIDLLNIPSGYSPVSVIAFGYADALENVADSFRERAENPRLRKETGQFVFSSIFQIG